MVDAAEREHLYEASGGNPFYLLQLALMTTDGRGAGAASGGADLPDAVAAAIIGELGALSTAPRRLAEATAVAGDPFELDLAVATAGLEDADALVALDELIDHDLVRSAEVPRRFHFRHPLARGSPPPWAGCRASPRPKR